MKFQCSDCGAEYEMSVEPGGQSMRCGDCGGVLEEVPASAPDTGQGDKSAQNGTSDAEPDEEKEGSGSLLASRAKGCGCALVLLAFAVGAWLKPAALGWPPATDVGESPSKFDYLFALLWSRPGAVIVGLVGLVLLVWAVVGMGRAIMSPASGETNGTQDTQTEEDDSSG